MIFAFWGKAIGSSETLKWHRVCRSCQTAVASISYVLHCVLSYSMYYPLSLPCSSLLHSDWKTLFRRSQQGTNYCCTTRRVGTTVSYRPVCRSVTQLSRAGRHSTSRSYALSLAPNLNLLFAIFCHTCVGSLTIILSLLPRSCMQRCRCCTRNYRAFKQCAFSRLLRD